MVDQSREAGRENRDKEYNSAWEQTGNVRSGRFNRNTRYLPGGPMWPRRTTVASCSEGGCEGTEGKRSRSLGSQLALTGPPETQSKDLKVCKGGGGALIRQSLGQKQKLQKGFRSGQVFWNRYAS